MKLKSVWLCCLILCLAVSLSADGLPAAGVAVTASDRIIPHVVDGSSWKSVFFLTNLDAKTLYYRVFYFDDTGAPMVLGFDGIGPANSIFGALTVGQTVSFATTGTGANLLEGWAQINTYDRLPTQAGAMLTNDLIGGLAVFRQTIAGRPDFEAVVPVGRGEQVFGMVFDNRNGFSTGIALLNLDATPVQATVTIRNGDGTLVTQDMIPLPALSKSVFSMPTKYPSSNGQFGTMKVSTSGTTGISGLGLRFNPGGAFTSFHTLSSALLTP